jgi:uncharacterized repeat protein (TIGR03833 family)
VKGVSLVDGRNRSDVARGADVSVVLKEGQPTGKQTRGIVQDLLTRSEFHLLIPTKAVTDSDLIPVTRSDGKPVTLGAKRRWRSYGA